MEKKNARSGFILFSGVPLIPPVCTEVFTLILTIYQGIINFCIYFDNVRLSRGMVFRSMTEARGFGARAIDKVLGDVGTSLVKRQFG